MQYELMNKNTPLLLFACHQNEYGETEAWESAWRSEMRPLGLRAVVNPEAIEDKAHPNKMVNTISSIMNKMIIK